LRTVQNIWRYEHQNENARLIADKAGTLYDKIRGFVEDVEKLGNQLNTVHRTYDAIVNKLSTGSGNLLRQASAFEELGVKVKKKLPRSLMEQTALDDSDSQ
jgi:DNA recombination protein RmuC